MDLSDAITMTLALLIFAGIVLGPIMGETAWPVSPEPTGPQGLATVLTGLNERVLSGNPINLTPLTMPETTAWLIVPDENETANQDENSTQVTPEYDDDELIGLVANSSVSLMLLAMQNAHALYAWDEKTAREHAATLQGFARSALKESAGFSVSTGMEETKTSYTLALESYVAYADIVLQNDRLNATLVDTAFQELERGSGYLREALDGIDRQTLRVPAEVVDINLPVAQPSTVPADTLTLMQRYVYDDRIGANEISIMLISADLIHEYYLNGEEIAAEPGRAFLVVEVKVMNLGHKGERRIYTIRTPEVSAFTLYYRGTTYSPIKLVHGTTLGEPYAGVTLDRYEKKHGYIVFDVPDAINLSECFIRVNLGEAGSPTWALGKKV
ncbi:hypothetical protein [Methanoculleus sp.]|uniref:hypothetical protein n=1 Tax=Methanoculleus sp. TaxID=90427 RepID=UPI00262E59D1|nr:hypothetical protein [Methanoculleus sp.]MDI6867686.1 hypothetical protein [Methanoculleus sp.]